MFSFALFCFMMFNGFICESVYKTPDASSQKEASYIKVGILQNQSKLVLSVNKPYIISDEATQTVLVTLPANIPVAIEKKGNQMILNKNGFISNSIIIKSASDTEGLLTKIGDKAYRGNIIIKNTQQGLTAIDNIYLEEYLYGVLPVEMSAEWPQEALKAQAVAARTFALYSKGKHKADGFDVCSSTHCQSYAGVSREVASACKAVDDTRGIILCYQEKPIYAAYHSSSGGMTENSEDVWGSYLPYLRAVQDDDTGAPAHNWHLKLSSDIIQKKLYAAGYDIGTLQEMVLSSFSGQSIHKVDRTVSKRVRTIDIQGSKKTLSLTGQQLRHILSLQSTMFEVNRHGTDYFFNGYGSGHGLGMSQWGARNMAQKGRTYQSILFYYYKDTELKKIY